MRTALVTGGAGFIGTAVVRALAAAGVTVHVAGGSDDPLTAARIASFPSVDLIVHCAGGSSVGDSLADPLRDFARTVTPLAELLEHVRTRAPATRVVVLSSGAVYGAATQLPTPEPAAIAPLSPYGVHKRLCEQLCESYGRTYGVSSIVLRLFSVYGPNLRKQLLWDACHKARAGVAMFAGSGDEQRDWLHVSDAAALIAIAADHASPQVPIVNGGTGIGVRVRDVVEQICEAPTFSGVIRAGDPSHYIADITRARALGWAPRVELARGIAEYVAWFRDHA